MSFPGQKALKVLGEAEQGCGGQDIVDVTHSLPEVGTDSTVLKTHPD